MFGLVALLVGIAIICLLFVKVTAPSIEKSKDAENRARQMTGKDESGIRVQDSFKTSGLPTTGKFRQLQVDAVTPGGPMDTFYGLKPGDLIVRVGQLDIASYEDADEARTWVIDAYTKRWSIEVMRAGEHLTLPQPKPRPRTTDDLPVAPGL